MRRFVLGGFVAALAVGGVAQGCAAIFDATQGPRLYGGTRLLLDDPLPTDPSAPDAPDARVLAGALWLFDLPLSLALDTALAPLAAAWHLAHDPEEAEPAVASELTPVALHPARLAH